MGLYTSGSPGLCIVESRQGYFVRFFIYSYNFIFIVFANGFNAAASVIAVSLSCDPAIAFVVSVDTALINYSCSSIIFVSIDCTG